MEIVQLKDEIDFEWVQLIKEALDIGISKEEILAFLKEEGKRTRYYF